VSTERLTREELAMDHALGLCEGEALERAERLEATDALYIALLADMRMKLSELDHGAPERAPASISFDTLTTLIDARQPAPPAPAAVPATPASPGLLERLGFFRPAALAAGLAAALLGGTLLIERSRPPDTPVYVAVLETPEGRPAAVVNAFADGTVTLVPIETIGVPQGRILEVWTLQTREQGPVSVGRMDKARTLKLDLNRLARPDIGHLFEITVEPPGGSPTGRPTGPVLMKGLASTAL
jgi:anti-sigma-K factor RskA